jgi:hypothetical protein
MFPQANRHLNALDWWHPWTLGHEFVVPETACRGDTPDFLGGYGHVQSVRERHSTTPAMTLAADPARGRFDGRGRREPGSVDIAARHARRVVAVLFRQVTLGLRRGDKTRLVS